MNLIVINVLEKLNNIFYILSKTSVITTGISIFIERIKSLKNDYQNGEDVFRYIINFIDGLDRGLKALEEWQNYHCITQCIELLIEVMSELGYEEIKAEVGEKFDFKIHKAVDSEYSDQVEDGTILEIISRGFKGNGKIQYPKIVVSNRLNSTVSKYSDKPNQSFETIQPCENNQLTNNVKSDLDTYEKFENVTNLPKDMEVISKNQVEYKEELKKYFQSLENDSNLKNWLSINYEKIINVYSLNFDPIIERLLELYSGKYRNMPVDPVAITRSLLLMTEFKITSITAWVKELKALPYLEVISGFEAGKSPSVGTYYHFFNRLENGPYEPKCKHRHLQSDMRKKRVNYSKPKVKPEDKELKKKVPQKEDVLKKLVAELEKKSTSPIPNDIEKILNEMLMEVAVKPSIGKGLIEETKNLTLCGDGSTVQTGASTLGKKTCNCRKNNIYDCDCLRKYSDNDAEWGWDNRIGDFVFGHRFYQFVVSENKHDFPFYISFASANKHEAVMCLEALERIRKQNYKLLPEAKIEKVSLDAIHDAYAFYNYLINKEIKYAIPYAKNPPELLEISGIQVNKNGIPICRGGYKMRRMCKHKRGQVVFNCPIKRPTHKGDKHITKIHFNECSMGELCEPNSKWGPFASVKPKDDPRIFPEITRGSEEYNRLRKLRSSCERSNAAKKEHFLLKYTKTRVQPYIFIRTILTSILEHTRVWVKDALKNLKITKENVLSLFE